MADDKTIKPFVFYSNKLDFKSFVNEKGVKEYHVGGHSSTDDLDLVNDIMTKECQESMNTQFAMRSIKLDFEHETLRGRDILDTEANKTKIVLGKAIKNKNDSKGLYVDWRLNPTWKKYDSKGNVTMTFEELWQNVEEEFYDAFSVAFVPTKVRYVEKNGTEIRLLDDVNLLNVALTGNPINPNAGIRSVMAKSLEFMESTKKSDPNDIDLIEIKSKVDKINLDLSELKGKMECNSMVDKKDNQKPDENQTAENTNNASVDQKSKDTSSTDFSELKSMMKGLGDEIKSLKQENADLKAIVEKPMQKAKGAENQESKGNENVDEKSYVGPLDVI